MREVPVKEILALAAADGDLLLVEALGGELEVLATFSDRCAAAGGRLTA
jgi:hypothetical protein